MIGRLVEDAVRAPPVRVRPEACLEQVPVRSARSACGSCEASCPHGAIALGPDGPSVAPERCDGCLRCAVACPTAAIQATHGAKRRLLAMWRTTRAGQPLTVRCDAARASDSLAGAVPCVSGVSWEAWVVPLLLGAAEVRLVPCPRCAEGEGARQLRGEVDAAASMARALGLGTVSAVSPGARRPADPRVSRRAMFSALFRQGRTAALQVGAAVTDRVDEALGSEEDHPLDDPLWARRTLARLLAARGAAATLDGPPSRVGRPRIREADCTRCGLCAVACPTRALRHDGHGAEAGTIQLEPIACTGCHACEVACPEGALDVLAGADLSAWTAGEAIELAPRLDVRCTRCGGPAISSLVRRCPACYSAGRLEGMEFASR